MLARLQLAQLAAHLKSSAANSTPPLTEGRNNNRVHSADPGRRWLRRRGSGGGEAGWGGGLFYLVQQSLVHRLLHLRAAWRISPATELTVRVQNALDRRYETYGALGSTVFDAAGQFTGNEVDALFVAPGAQRSFFVGVRFTY